jgi:hypothetical protein
MKETKKVLDAEAKVLAKAQAKADKEAAKAQLKLNRAAERARIKEDAKKAREEAKHAKLSNVVPEGNPKVSPVVVPTTPAITVHEGLLSNTAGYEEESVAPRKFIIPEES